MYRLLIVEDEHLIRKWLRYAIDYQSLNILVVGEAKDGKEGAQLIQEEQPDIVLSDINMPIMTAFDMFEATKGQSYAKIILSGYADFPNAQSAIHYGVLEFLTKPLEKQALIDCLKTIMARIEEHKEKHLHITLSDYINQYRINQAIQLMFREPDLMVYQIAEAVGIYDYRYFDRVFKKYLGQTVKAFKEEHIFKQMD